MLLEADDANTISLHVCSFDGVTIRSYASLVRIELQFAKLDQMWACLHHLGTHSLKILGCGWSESTSRPFKLLGLFCATQPRRASARSCVHRVPIA
jgi:hypothetical protein